MRLGWRSSRRRPTPGGHPVPCSILAALNAVRRLATADSPSVPAVGLPEGLGPGGRAVAVLDIGPERPQLAAAVGGRVVLAQVEDAVAQQQLAEPERRRGRVVGGQVAAGLVHDDPALGRRGPRQVAGRPGPRIDPPPPARAARRRASSSWRIRRRSSAERLRRAAAAPASRATRASILSLACWRTALTRSSSATWPRTQASARPGPAPP